MGKPGDHHIQLNPRPKECELPEGYDPVKQFGHLIKNDNSGTLLMVNHMYTPAEADELVKEGKIDMVCFGRPFIHNPVRCAENDPLMLDRRTDRCGRM